jgi:hypothetical protein
MRSRSFSIIVTLAVVFCLTQQVSRAQSARGPSTESERAQAVRLSHALEDEPFNEGAKKARAWLATFWEEVPDIGVELCAGFFDPLLGKDKNYGKEIFAQWMFSSGAYMIEHPDKAKDREAVFGAGVDGMLKTYEAILKEKPKAKWSFLDDLIQKRNSGKLAEWVSETTKKCGQPGK